MKITLSAIILTSLLVGLWQNRELSRLKDREEALALVSNVTPASGRDAGKAGTTAGGPADTRKRLDAKGFVKRFEELVAGNRQPSDEERIGFGETLMSASQRELKTLVEEVRRSHTLPQDLKNSLFAAIAPRLAESHPELAAEIALEGAEGNPFRSVMRTWLLADPKAAAAWLGKQEAGLNDSRFRSMDDLDLEVLVAAARIASDPPGGPALDRVLKQPGTQRQKVLEELVAATHPGDLPALVKRISRSPVLTEEKARELIGVSLASHRDPAMARQILLDARLPEPRFIGAALVLIRKADPSTLRSSVDWFMDATTNSPERAKALEEIRAQWAARSPEEAGAYFREKNSFAR